MKVYIPVNINNKLYKDNKKYLSMSLSQDFMMNSGLRVNDFITIYFEQTEINKHKFLKMIVHKIINKNCQKWKILNRSKSKSDDGEIRITISDSINEKIKNENFCKTDCEVLDINPCKGTFSVLLPDFFISSKLSHNLSIFDDGLVNEEEIKSLEKNKLNKDKMEKIKYQSTLHQEISNLNYYILFLVFIDRLIKDLQTENVYLSVYRNKNYLFLKNGTIIKKIREKHLSQDNLIFMQNFLGSTLNDVFFNTNQLIPLDDFKEVEFKHEIIMSNIDESKNKIKILQKNLKKEKFNPDMYQFL